MSSKLQSPVQFGRLSLKNRIIMAPMTRSRGGADGTATPLMAQYYGQRASAGMIISEGVQPSADGKGYMATPGIYTEAQIASWQPVTEAVHAKGGTMVMQIMHCGRVGHPDNKDPGAETVAPSAIKAEGEIFTPNGMKDFIEPRALTLSEIDVVIAQYRQATENAYAAGFDGVELHCTSGYLPAQFLATGSNQRQDQYGGSVENRSRFVVEVLAAMASVDGADRVGLRICPGHPFNGLFDAKPLETFQYFLSAISNMGLAYLHAIKSPIEEIDVIELATNYFKGPLIINDGFDQDSAENIITEQQVDAVSFGRFYISNPDLVKRFECDLPLAEMDFDTIYGGEAKGYSDYPEAV
ncbi:N-ethylmaleimide reductase [Sinobacterium norvegicum]|uniref:N-ethylmaleimide reductase n=1 Tax=Sinobacterium norvegicum TaxID=1641715 RepID=A0ABN8EJJ9_9GAMM|nr:alkene reductase [Sinobacterium norvegicum]CAH0990221.1 N-ethylmaleimide reductase [Sinobacterium norvegicum]